MSLLNDAKLASPWNLEDSDTRRSERMVRSLTERIPHDTTLVEISRTCAFGGYPETEQYVRRLDVAHISQAGWVDLYTGQVNDSGRDAFRHISLSSFDMEKLLTVYLAEHGDVLSRVLANMGLLLASTAPDIAAQLNRDFPDLDENGSCGDPGCKWCGDGSNARVTVCETCGCVLPGCACTHAGVGVR